MTDTPSSLPPSYSFCLLGPRSVGSNKGLDTEKNSKEEGSERMNLNGKISSEEREEVKGDVVHVEGAKLDLVQEEGAKLDLVQEEGSKPDLVQEGGAKVNLVQEGIRRDLVQEEGAKVNLAQEEVAKLDLVQEAIKVSLVQEEWAPVRQVLLKNYASPLIDSGLIES